MGIWPENKRIAVMVAFDLDAETLWLTRNSDNYRHVVNLSRGAYGPKQGMPRILEMLDQHGIKATFYIPAWVIEKYQEIVIAIHKKGHEIAYHGYLHEQEPGIGYQEADEIMEKSERIIAGITGGRPVGYRAPGGIVPSFMIEMLHKRGYLYTSSWRDGDGPFFHDFNGKKLPLLDFPQDSLWDDSSYFFATDNPPRREGIKRAQDMIEVWKEEFEALAAEGNKSIATVIHPQISGRISRINAISDFIGYMKARGAWIKRSDEIARYLIGRNL